MALSAHSAISFSISVVQPLWNFFLDAAVGGADVERLAAVDGVPGVGDSIVEAPYLLQWNYHTYTLFLKQEQTADQNRSTTYR